MRRINEDIKNQQFNHIYLLYGVEDYLRGQYRDKLQKALAGEDTMNYSFFEGKDIDVNGLIDLAETMPFLAERRVIFIENSGFFKQSQEKLADYLKQVPESTYFVFCEKEVDKRSRMYKAVQKNGYISEFGEQNEETLKKWVLSLVGKEGKKISTAALTLFLEKTGTDMENIRKEFEKLACYTMDRDAILPEDVEMICTERIQNRIFDMIEALSAGNQKKALDLYYDLLSLKEPPMRILFLISRKFNMLLQTKALLLKRYDNRGIGEKLGISPYIANKYRAQAAGFEIGFLRKALEDCVQTEEDVKTGRLSDMIAVEMLIITYSSKRSKGQR